MAQPNQPQITEILAQAGSAHHTYEQTELKGVYDEVWANWYADYVIQHGINDYLSESMTVETLAHAFSIATDAHTQSDQSVGWAEFTANRLVGG